MPLHAVSQDRALPTAFVATAVATTVPDSDEEYPEDLGDGFGPGPDDDLRRTMFELDEAALALDYPIGNPHQVIPTAFVARSAPGAEAADAIMIDDDDSDLNIVEVRPPVVAISDAEEEEQDAKPAPRRAIKDNAPTVQQTPAARRQQQRGVSSASGAAPPAPQVVTEPVFTFGQFKGMSFLDVATKETWHFFWVRQQPTVSTQAQQFIDWTERHFEVDEG